MTTELSLRLLSLKIQPSQTHTKVIVLALFAIKRKLIMMLSP